MANQQYDQLPELAAEMDWEQVPVYAFLCENAIFDSTHKRISQAASWAKREPLQGKFTDDDGNLCGQPAVFYMVTPEIEYQVLLGYDDGRHDELLLGFFDETADGPIQVQRRGSLFVRPVTDQGGDSPSYSIWLRPGLA